MKTRWLSTAALTFALGIGSGAVIAQQQSDLPQKRDEGSRSERQSLPSREAPAAREERPGGGMKDRMTQEGAKEPRRGEAASPRDQAQGQHEQKQPARQSQEQPGRGERPAAGATQQSQTQQNQQERRGREAEPANEQKRQSGREEQQKQDRAAETAKPGESKQRQDEQQPARGERPGATQQSQTQQSQEERKGREADRAGETKQPPGREQAAQPSANQPAQQTARPGEEGQARQRENVGQAQDQSNRRTSMVNDQQRTQIVDRLQRERDSWRETQNINIRVNVGERLPERVRPRPLPPDILRIAPEYRDYEYSMVEDEIVIVDPRTRDVVDVIDERGGRTAGVYASDRARYSLSLSREQRDAFKRLAQSTGTVGSTSPGATADSTCVTLRPVPDEMARNNPELASYRYVAIGDQIVLVDPRQQKVVDVIE